jgi:hypothetical protein
MPSSANAARAPDTRGEIRAVVQILGQIGRVVRVQHAERSREIQRERRAHSDVGMATLLKRFRSATEVCSQHIARIRLSFGVG